MGRKANVRFAVLCVRLAVRETCIALHILWSKHLFLIMFQ